MVSRKLRSVIEQTFLPRYAATLLFTVTLHPNYYGEILCWLGIFILSSYTLYLNSLLTLTIGFISPLFIYILLRYVSGIPILEKNSDKKFKGDKDYKKYKEQTNMLVLWFKKS